MKDQEECPLLRQLQPPLLAALHAEVCSPLYCGKCGEIERRLRCCCCR